jgi:hypothetical protein
VSEIEAQKSARVPDERRVRAARILALAVDALQWILLPVFAGGATSPLNNGLDVVVGVAMTWLVGWHWAFLPTFLAELIPFFDLVPTWTLAVFFATRRRSAPSGERRRGWLRRLTGMR